MSIELPRVLSPERSDTFPFFYNANSSKFNINGQSFGINDEDLALNLAFSSVPNIANVDIPKFPAVIYWCGILTTPKFYNWIEENFTEQLKKDVCNVIAEVVAALTDSNMKQNVRKADALFGFSLSKIRQGQVILTTIGHCACLCPKVEGHIVDYNEWGTKFTEYEFHNALDFPAQTISLLAGIGHLAMLCADQQT